jgi:acyl carrier protein
MKASDLTFFIFFGAVSAFILTMLLRDWFGKKRTVTLLTTRSQNNDDQFAHAYFADPKLADIAVRARRVLSNNLKMPLEGLTPGDRLNDDLAAELPANPHLFWELEAEFGIKIGLEDWETFEKTLERLVTFQDLVEFLQRKISEPPPDTPGENEDDKPSRAYEFAIRSIPILCIGGFVIAVVGILMGKGTAMNLGGLIFVSGIAVWGFANGGEGLRNIIQAVRGMSFKEIGARPLPLIFFTCLALFFLWMGCIVSWGILKNLLSSK